MAALDHKKVKIKDASDGENLFKAPNDGRLDTLLEHFHEQSPILIEPTQSINIGITEAVKNIHLAESLTEEESSAFIIFFKEHQINFAWSYINIPGVDPHLIMHHLSISLGVKSVKQKLRQMIPQVALMVKTELKKLLDFGFIRPIDYAEWISNIVPVSKLDDSIRICTDFRDVNKACPKDDFPLPSIDIIVDLIAGHAMLSLMDGFLGYNQIKIAPRRSR